MEKQRFAMFCDYINELQTIKKSKKFNTEEIKKIYNNYINLEHSDWINVLSDEGNLVGFAIIGYYPNCHPDAEVYISEVYIMPEYRRKRYMHRTITEYIKKNPGTYCLFILNENHNALKFWNQVFSDNGYEPVELADIGAADEHCTQYGFKKGATL